MSLPTHCPGCKSELKETAKGHCQEARSKPCGWVRCTACQAIVDAKGTFYDPRALPPRPLT